MRNWRELFCGSWSVSWQVWLLQSLIGVPFNYVRLRAFSNVSSIETAIALISGPALAGIVFVLASFTVLRKRSQRMSNPIVVGFVWLLAAIARTVTVALLLLSFGVVTQALLLQIVMGVFFVFIWTIILTYLIAASSISRDRALSAEAQLEVVSRLERRRAIRVAEESKRLTSIVSDALIPEMANVRSKLHSLTAMATPQQWNAVADFIGGILIDRVRGASRAVLEEGGKQPIAMAVPRETRWRNYVSDLTHMSVSVGISISLFVSFGSLIAVPRLGLWGIALMALMAGASLPLLVLGRWLSNRCRPGVGRLLLVVVVYLANGVLIAELITAWPGVIAFNASAAIGIFIVILGFVAGLAASLTGQHQYRWDSYLRSQVDMLKYHLDQDARLSRELVRVQRQASGLLHGPVQGNLAAITLCLRIHALSPPREFISSRESVVSRALRLLDDVDTSLESVLSEERAVEADFSTYLDTLSSAWLGLIHVETDLDSNTLDILSKAPLLSTTVVSIVEEAMINASRHGDARNVWIHITADSVLDEVQIEILNDGQLMQSPFTVGLGMQAIDDFGGKWSLNTMPTGQTQLYVVLSSSGHRSHSFDV